MKTSLPIFAFLILLFASCGNDKSTAETSTAAPETEVSDAYAAADEALKAGKSPAEVSELLMGNFAAVSDAGTGALNMAASKEFARVAQELSDKYPGDTTAAMPFYRSAEVVRAMNDPKRAAAIYEEVYKRYPDFSKAPEAMFMLAFTYDEDLKNFEAAKKTYTDFLAKYPNHSFADDTEMLLRNLGKSDEEILQELEANMQKQ